MSHDNLDMICLTERQKAEALLQAITVKQRAVLDLLVQHHTTKEIARKLQISPNTVDQRLLAAREKLGATDRKQTARKYTALLELCEETPYDFSLVDESSDAFDDLVSGLHRDTGFELQDSVNLGGYMFESSSRFRPEALDARFGKLWRIFAIPFFAVLVGMVLIWGLAFAQALGGVI